MKRKAVSILMCAAMALGTFGSVQVASAEETERTMTFLHWRTEDKAAFEELAAQYEEQHPGLHIEIEIVPSEDYAKTLIMRAQGGEASDVFAVNPDGDFGSEIATGVMMELNDCDQILDNYEEDALGAGTRDGKIYAVVQTTNPLAIYYNKDIFAEYDLEVPTTVEAFMNVCETLKSNGVTPMAEGAGESWMPEFLIEGILANSMDDTSLFSTGDLMADLGFVDAVQVAKDIYDNGYIMEGSSGISEESLLTGFAVGNYAMIATGTWSMATIRNIDDTINFGVFNMPGSKGTTKGVSNTGLMLGINKDSAVLDDAIGFVDYLTSSEPLTYFANATGQLTVAKDVSIESEDLKMAQELLEGPDGIVSAPFHQTNAEGLDVCMLRSVSLVIQDVGDAQEFAQAWADELTKALTQE